MAMKYALGLEQIANFGGDLLKSHTSTSLSGILRYHNRGASKSQTIFTNIFNFFVYFSHIKYYLLLYSSKSSTNCLISFTDPSIPSLLELMQRS